MQSDFETSLSAARAELVELQAFLKKVERLVKKGELDKKAVIAIYKSVPEQTREMIRGVAPVTAKAFMPQTKVVIAELNRMFVVAQKMGTKKD